MAKDICLTYYLYTPIENAKQLAADHLAFCKSIGLKGRILVVTGSGINGTVSVTTNNTKIYGLCSQSPQEWRIYGSRLMKKTNKPSRRCLLQKEIVHLGLEDNDFDNDINPLVQLCHLSPKKAHEALLDEDTVVCRYTMTTNMI